MNENGWILLSRKILDWQWWGKAEMVKLWLYLLLSANIEDRKWQGMVVKRGQLVTSVKSLSERLDISTWKIREGLNRLQTTGEIITKTTNKFTVITICNYCSYQDYAPNAPQTNHNQTANAPQTNHNQTATTKQLTINNNNNSLSPTRAREAETEKNFFEGNPTPQPTALATATEEKEKSSAQKEKDFTPPTVEQVRQYCKMTGLIHVNEVLFVAHYESTGWCNGSGTPLRSWQAAAIKWNEKEKQRIYQQQKTASSNGNLNNRQERATRHASCEPRTDVSADEF